MLYKLCLIVNVGLVFYKGSCERLILSLAQSVFILIVFYMFVFYEQINDDNDDEDYAVYSISHAICLTSCILLFLAI